MQNIIINSVHLVNAKKLISDGWLDYIAMDIKAPWDQYHRLAGQACDTILLRRSMRIIAASGLPHEFRTTRVEALLSAEDCGEITRQVPSGSAHKWQRFRPEHSLDKALRPAGDSPGAASLHAEKPQHIESR